MFESELKTKFEQIFGVKVDFAKPGESLEQECLFVEIENTVDRIKDGREISKVTGNAVLFGNADKIPFGFFSKQIAKADPALTAPFFFFDFESNNPIFGNKVGRGLSFVYFYEGQYDPKIGTITSVDIEVEES